VLPKVYSGSLRNEYLRGIEIDAAPAHAQFNLSRTSPHFKEPI
jgi:hypothetical protein